MSQASLRTSLLSAFLFFAAFSGISGAPFAAEVRVDVQELELRLEDRLRSGLRSFLGSEATSVATVRVKLAPVAAKPAAKPSEKPKDSAIEDDFGYFPFPSTQGPESEKVEARVEARPEPKLDVASVDVDIRFSPTSSDEKRQQTEVRAFAEQLFAGYSPKVNVSLVKFPPLPKPADAQREPASKAPTVEEPPMWKVAMPYAAALICAGMLALAFGAIARGMSKAAEVVTGGILQIRAAMSEATAAARPQKQPEKKTEDKKTGTESEKSPSLSPEILAQNEAHAVRVIKDVLSKDPAIFTRAVGRDTVDLQGLRRLLPFLEETEQKALKGALGEAFFEELSADAGSGEMKFEEFSLWARALAERVVLRRAQGANALEKSLGTEGVLELSSASSVQLIEAIKKVGTPAAWRVGAEFLSAEQFSTLVAGAEGPELRMMIESASLPPQAWAEGAKSVLKEVSAVKAASGAQGDKKVQGFIRTKLLTPVLQSVQTKAFGEDEQYLSQLEAESPALASLVRESVWTAQELRRVPPPAWSQFIKTLGNEDRAALILSLPQDVSEMVRSAVPEGNARTMVLDRVKKQLAKNDAEAQKASLTRARELVSDLREAAASGEFQLTGEGAQAA